MTTPAVHSDRDRLIRSLLDEYIEMYAGRDDRLTNRFSDNFSGYTGGGDFLVKDRQAWVDITRQDFAQVPGRIRIEMLDVSMQDISHDVVVTTAFFHIHGENALICLKSPMGIMGDMTEQLASRQIIAHNRGFFQTAYELFVKDGKLKRGASSKPKKPKDRVAGDRTGFGSARRLAIALQRLDLTYDTEEMAAEQMKAVLPKEFNKWAADSISK